MCSPRLLLFSIAIGILQIHRSFAQLRNVTLLEQGIDELDYYDPAYYSSNITRIVGGKKISIRLVPWQVALYDRGQFICGASIVSVDWVLTAAHCVVDGGKFAVRAGSSNVKRGGQVRGVRAVVASSAFNSRTLNQDIAMIRVSSRFTITQYVQPIALASPGRSLPTRYLVTGWGSRKEDGPMSKHLRGVSIRRVGRSQCRSSYKRAGLRLTKSMFCANKNGRDACQGDSGGPLVRRNIQYGIVSFGVGCARSNYPGIYTNVERLHNWIRAAVNRHGGRMPRFV